MLSFPVGTLRVLWIKAGQTLVRLGLELRRRSIYIRVRSEGSGQDLALSAIIVPFSGGSFSSLSVPPLYTSGVLPHLLFFLHFETRYLIRCSPFDGSTSWPLTNLSGAVRRHYTRGHAARNDARDLRSERGEGVKQAHPPRPLRRLPENVPPIHFEFT